MNRAGEPFCNVEHMSSPDLTRSEHALFHGSNLLDDGEVTLREFKEEDFPQLVAWWNSPEWAALQQRHLKPRPEDDVAAMFRSWGKNVPGTLGVGFSIVGNDSGELLGHANLYSADVVARSAEYMIMLGPAHVGRGIGPRATALMLDYAFHELGLHRVGLKVFEFNSRAIRAYAKAGFVEEGRRREALYRAGQFHDEVLMSVLARDHARASRPRT